MTLRAALERLRRGYARMWGRALSMFHVKHVSEGSPGQIDQARETAASLNLMAQAEAAGAEMTPEQQIFLSQSEHGMRERLSVLLMIPHRTLAQEREKVAIDGWLARGGEAKPTLVRRAAEWRPQGLLSPLAALGGVRLWMVLAAGWALTGGAVALQTARLNHAKDALTNARQIARQNAEAAGLWRERSEHYRQGLIDAANVARMAADALEAERAAEARRQARERRRNREIQDVLAGSPEPPDWRLRGDTPAEGERPAARP